MEQEMDSDSQLSLSTSSEDMSVEMETDDDYEDFCQAESRVLLNMNDTIARLTNQLIIQYELCAPRRHVNPDAPQESIQTKIEGLFMELMNQVSENRDPVLRIRDRESWGNCIFDNQLCLKPAENCTHREIKFCTRKSLPKFSLIFYILGKIYKLLITGETCTKREFYYQNIDFISEQSALDSALNEISCLLDCPLYRLNLYATSKGVIAGPLKIITNRDVIDCGFDNPANTRGVMIPNDVCNITDLQTNAKFVLLIEKDAVFQKLIDSGIGDKFPPCIFVTGKGMPDINTRSLLKTIWNKLHIPILAFVDADPWGIDIMCIYRFGSRALSHQADLLAVPSIRWLGPFPSEVSKLCDNTTTLTTLDQSKLSDLLERPYVKANKKIGFEITYMLTMNLKAEIEDLEFSVGYLTNVFLPHKIALGDYL